MMRAGLALLLLLVASAVACVEGPTSAATLPVLADVSPNTWATVSTGQDHTCALDTLGVAYCWGSNQFGQLGVVSGDTTCGPSATKYRCTLVPVPVNTTARFLSVSAGGRHTCGVTTTHIVACWGANDFEQLGDQVPSGPTLISPDGLRTYASVSAGYTHTCGLRTNGLLNCWGSNGEGEAGVGTGGTVLFPLQVSGNQIYTSVSAGQQRTCAVPRGGVVQCWGQNWLYREGDLEYTSSLFSPAAVGDAPILGSVSVGTFTTCGVNGSGTAYCWEANPRGTIGDGTTDGSLVPTAVISAVPFKQISSGQLQTCGVTTAGVGYCWGDNSFGQLGLPPGSEVNRCGSAEAPCATVPVELFGEETFIMISTGFGSHTCGVTTQHNIYCWGLGLSGQRGDGTEAYAVSVPVLVAPAEGVGQKTGGPH